MALTPEQFTSLKPGDMAWLHTGRFTASRVQIVATDGVGATRRAWVTIIDRAPGQPTVDDLNNGKGIPVSARSLALPADA